MTDQEGLIKLLNDPQLKPLVPMPELPAPCSAQELSEEKDWQTDTVPVKWEKIKSAWMNGKTAAEVKEAAMEMAGPAGVAAWLELCSKMAPKQVDINTVQITAIRIELPPINNSDLGDIIDVEVPA